MSEWRTYKTHQQAECFQCDHLLFSDNGEVKESKYPKTRGQFVKQCPNCGLFTWYDLEEKEEAK